MKQKLINGGYPWISILLVTLFLIPSISASDLSISLIPHYYSGSNEILVYDNQTAFTGISFDIFGSNNLKDQRILSLSISDSSPTELTAALPKKTIDFIRILEKDKLLYTSDVISVKDFNETSINFSVSIIGISEADWILERSDASRIIYIKNTEDSSIKSFGAILWPSNPAWGVVIWIALGISLIAVLYNYEIGKKINLWRRKNKLKKMDKIQQEERWRKMR